MSVERVPLAERQCFLIMSFHANLLAAMQSWSDYLARPASCQLQHGRICWTMAAK
jgi:hypothetical protein